MNMPNPYAPPGSRVEDVSAAHGGFQPVRLWPVDGRIGRLRFLAYSVGAWVLATVVAMVAGFAFGALGNNKLIALAPMLSVLVYFVVSYLLLIQRSHDMNLSGWFSLLALIPLVGLVWVFKGGTPGANRFGAPPPPNTLGVKIIACVFPLIFVIGILAAIALPAYQQYTVKARAAQAR